MLDESYSDDNADGDDCDENDDDMLVCTSGSVGLDEPVPALRASVSHRAPTRHFALHPHPPCYELLPGSYNTPLVGYCAVRYGATF